MNKEDLEYLATGKPFKDFQYDQSIIGDEFALKITHLPTGLFERDVVINGRSSYFHMKQLLLLKLAIKIRDEDKSNVTGRSNP
jgi:hypothetical protein